TLFDLLTIHKKIVSDFFQLNSDLFSNKINLLISSHSYVAKRQSIKLLAQLLLTKSNYYLLTNYVNSPVNLKIIMTLLGDKSKNIQMESFHVFKVFIANPKKTKPVLDILIKNREKLLNFLTNFNILDKKDDGGAFLNEKSFIIDQIEKLPKIIPTTPLQIQPQPVHKKV
ncbi:Mo25 family protein, partial [Acinetobacter baumannii]|nr:Mo25 family protein [Acinetobacter baumannii]